MFSFGTNTRTETPLIYCVHDHALLQAPPDIKPTLLQFINIMNVRLTVCTVDLHPRLDEY